MSSRSITSFTRSWSIARWSQDGIPENWLLNYENGVWANMRRCCWVWDPKWVLLVVLWLGTRLKFTITQRGSTKNGGILLTQHSSEHNYRLDHHVHVFETTWTKVAQKPAKPTVTCLRTFETCFQVDGNVRICWHHDIGTHATICYRPYNRFYRFFYTSNRGWVRKK